MNDSIDFASVERYVAGQCTPAERARIEAWIRGEPGRHEYIESLRAIGVAWADELPGYDSTAAWAAVRERVTSGAPGVRPEWLRAAPIPRRWPHRVGTDRGWRLAMPAAGARTARRQSLIAAMIVVGVGIGVAVGSLRHRASGVSPSRTYATAAGQRLSMTLADGTQLTLAPASRVHVAADYGHPTGAREVELEGEAYFAVAHDAAHPFAVSAHGVVVRDIGTAFDMRAYPADAGTRIAVAEGAVAVTTASRCGVGVRAGRREPCSAEAKAGDVATVADGAVAVEHGVDVASLTTWTRGALTFQRTPLRDVAAELSRWYDVNVVLGDASLAEKRVSGTFEQESIRPVLDLVAAAAQARYVAERSGAQYTLYSNEAK